MPKTLTSLSKTALAAAYIQALDDKDLGPDFTDPYGDMFLDDEGRAMGEQLIQLVPVTLKWVKYRNRYFDEVLLKQIRSGVKQVVELGGGFSTRFIRYQSEDVVFYEIDV